MPVGPWPKGKNNRADETSLPTDDKGNIIALREAMNVDITSRGNAHTRGGYRKVFAGSGVHSGFAHAHFPSLLAVNANALTAFDLGFNPTVVRSGLRPMADLSYAEVNGVIFWSNGFDQGMLSADLIDHPFGLAGPAGTPVLTSTAGALNPGDYQVACTFLANTGEESGSTLAAVVSVPPQGGIVVSNIPQPSDARVVAARIYLSEDNGDALYWYRNVPVGTLSITIGSVVQLGKLLETQWLRVMPPGQIVRYFNGRLLVAAGNVLCIGTALHYGLYRPSKDYVIHSFPITLLEPVGQADEGGIFITSGHRTYYLRGGDPKGASQLIAHPFGAMPGTGRSVPGYYFDPQLKSDVAYWIDSQGVPMLGLPGGEVRALTRDSYVAPLADSGSTLIRDINGYRQVITNLRGAAYNTARAGDSVVATVYRNGVAV